MTRSLFALIVMCCASAPAFADACDAVTEAATRAALDNASAANRRTATVRVKCEGETKTFLLHRSGKDASASVSVREIKTGELAGGAGSGAQRDRTGSSTSRVIRVGN